MPDHSSRYDDAMRQVDRAQRRGDLKAAAAWLAIAERHIRIEDHLTEQPYRLKALEHRARFPR